jgi:1-phosphofructokinase family hexose kinase
MILGVGQNLAWQKLCFLPALLHGEVNRVTKVTAFASSKGPNVVRALSSLGGAGETFGYVGGETGRRVTEYLAAEGLAFRPVTIAGETRTCTTYIEPDGTCTELIEPPPAVSAAESELMAASIIGRLEAARLLVISGTALSGESEACYARLVRAAHERGMPVLMDSAGTEARRALDEHPDVVKVNAEELGHLTGADTGDQAERAAACTGLMSRYGIRWVLVSRGRDGIEAHGAGVALHAVPPVISVVNAIGSGDAAMAGLAWTLHESAEGWNEVFASPAALKEALLTATAMGTANCLNFLNGRVEPDDYRQARAKIVITQLEC